MTSVAVTADAVGLAGADRFYFRMAIACAAVAFLGFAPTYWMPMVRGTLNVPPLAHLHALLFYGWTLLFIKQTHLVATRRVAAHRELGIAGVALATSMLFVGIGLAMSSVKRFAAGGLAEEGRVFAVVSVSAIVTFVILFAIAVRSVRRPDAHKRLMLIATISLLQAAVGRWFLYFLGGAPGGAITAPPPVWRTITPGLVTDILIVVAMVHDRRTSGRVHPAYWIGGAVVLGIQVLRIPVSSTAAWDRTAGWLLSLMP
jgi:hypothetical protein